MKHAYNYEQWDTFDALMENVMAAIHEVKDPKFAPDEKALEILQVWWKMTLFVANCICI